MGNVSRVTRIAARGFAPLTSPGLGLGLGLVLAALCVGGEALAAAPGFDPAVATQAYLDSVPAEARARSDAYFEGGYWLQLWSFLLTAAIMIGLLRTGASARIRALIERYVRRVSIIPGLYALLFLWINAALQLGWNLYTDYFREHAYGLSNLSLVQWFVELLKGLAVGSVLLPLVAMAIYAVFRRAPRRWWMWATAVMLVFTTLGGAIAPVYIAPVFNTYSELEDGPVRRSVLRMARASGVKTDKVLKNDASRQSTRIRANVSGMLGTERITLNDNLLTRCTPEEVEAVMGHEIGHYVLNHAYESIITITLMLMLMFAATQWAFDRAVARWGERWGVRGIADPAGLPLLMLIVSALGLLATPVSNTIIRVNEAEADIYGLNAARQPEGFATVALKLGEYRKLDPSLEEFIFFDHPSGRARIRMAMEWKAAHIAKHAPE